MRRITIVIFLVVLGALTVYAQCPLKKGEHQFNAGFGFSNGGVPIYAGIDFGVFNDITIGIEGSFRSYNENLYGSRYTSAVFGIAANGNYHFNTVLEIPKKWDFYAGITLGYYSWSLPSDYPGDNSSGLGLGAQIGGRYFFNRNFGVNLEFGGGNSFSGGKIGITYTLGK